MLVPTALAACRRSLGVRAAEGNGASCAGAGSPGGGGSGPTLSPATGLAALVVNASLGAVLVAGAACSGGTGGSGLDRTGVPAAASAATRPNIVWIVADSIAGGAAIARLGGGRMLVADTAAVASDAASARAGLLTGVRPATLGLDRTTGRLAAPPPAGLTVLPEQLRRLGYYTSRAGPPRHNLRAGGTEPVAIVHVDGGVHAAARALPVPVEDLAQPGLLGAWDAAGPDADWRGRNRDWESPCTVSFGCGGARSPGDRPFFALFNVDAGSSGREPALDEQVASIVESLAVEDLLEDTVVFLIGVGATPTVAVRWPARVAGAVEPDPPVSLQDLAPTALALAGAAAPAYMEGRTLVDAARNDPPRMPAPATAAKREAGGAPGAGVPRAAASAPRPTEVPVAATPGGYPTGGLFHVAPRVDLRCATAGSTIVYTTEHEAPFYWRLYTGPFRMRFWTLRFQCGRLGYRDSDIVTYDFDIE